MKMCVWEDVRCEDMNMPRYKMRKYMRRYEDMKIGRYITDANNKPNY